MDETGSLQPPSEPLAPPSPPDPSAVQSSAHPTLPAPDAIETDAVLRPAGPPRRTRGVLIGGLATVAVVGVVAAGFLVLSGSGADDTNDRLELSTDADESGTQSNGYSYSAASAAVRESNSLTFEMSTVAPEGPTTITARIDRATRRAAFEADISQVLPADDDLTTGDTIEMIVDGPTGNVYMSTNALGDLLGDIEQEWLIFDSEMGGSDSSEFDQLFTNPLTVTDVLGDLEPVDLGQETTDGETLQHYQVTADEQTLSDASGTDTNMFGDAFGTTPGTDVVYDVWVSEDNQVRRISFDAVDPESGDATMVDLHIDVSADPVIIDVPDSDAVMDIEELFGGFTADVPD